MSAQGRLEGEALAPVRVSVDCLDRQSALNATEDGRNGLKPAAIESALTKTGQSASFGRNSVAKVVFPAPFGPATISIFLCAAICLMGVPSGNAERGR